MTFESLAGHGLYIFHAFIGTPGKTPGAMNDINVLQRSDLSLQLDYLQNMAQWLRIRILSTADNNGRQYEKAYMLCDGISKFVFSLVKTIAEPSNEKEKYFPSAQESTRKDLQERTFGVLQSQFVS